MTQCLSMKMGGEDVCFHPLPAHTHAHFDTPSWPEGVCVSEVRAWG